MCPLWLAVAKGERGKATDAAPCQSLSTPCPVMMLACLLVFPPLHTHTHVWHQVQSMKKKQAALLESGMVPLEQSNDWTSLVGNNIRLASPYLIACDTDDTLTKPDKKQGTNNGYRPVPSV